MVLALVLLAACRGSAPTPGPVATVGSSETGAATARQAAEGFIKGVKDGDLQAMSNLWGTERGVTRAWLDRDQHDQRLIIMQCYLSHDRSRVVGDPTQKADTAVVAVELQNGQQRAQTSFKMLQGPRARWYVAMIEPLPDFCRR